SSSCKAWRTIGRGGPRTRARSWRRSTPATTSRRGAKPTRSDGGRDAPEHSSAPRAAGRRVRIPSRSTSPRGGSPPRRPLKRPEGARGRRSERLEIHGFFGTSEAGARKAASLRSLKRDSVTVVSAKGEEVPAGGERETAPFSVSGAEPAGQGRTIREGEVLGGKYQVDRVLRTGGMGVVLVATHVQLKEKGALKVLRGQAAEEP